MKQLISAMFDDYDTAAAAVGRLESAGIPSEDISIVGGSQSMRSSAGPGQTESSGAGTGAATGAVVGGGAGLLAGLGMLAIPGLGPVAAAGWLASTLTGAVVGTAAGGLIGALTDLGLSEEEAHGYAEGVRRGGTLVTARVDEAQVDRAVEILDTDGAVDMQERTAAWRNEGWQGPSTGASRATSGGPPLAERAEGEAIPIVEEELNVGKRKITTGRVRLHAHTVSEQVEVPVTLHDEKVRIERRPVDRPATGAAVQPEKVIEEFETREVPVVDKQGRVVEEVRISKEARDRTEVIKDDVKKTDVEIEDTRDEGASRPQRGKRR